jgi:hypothetical protein
MRIVSMDSSNEAKQDRKSKSSETESKSWPSRLPTILSLVPSSLQLA